MQDNKKPWLTKEQQAIRELQLFFLCKLYKGKNCLVFKGGTAIDLFYGSNRFSEDLDFDCKDMEGLASIDEAIEELTGNGYAVFNDWFKEREMHNGFIRYSLRVSAEGIENLIDLKIDYSVDTPKYAPARLPLKCNKSLISVNVMHTREILAEKVRAIMERRKARDLYDLYYMIEAKKVPVSIKDIYEKCRRGVSGKPVSYSFSSFKRRVLSLKSGWKELEPLLEQYKTYGFDDVAESVIDSFRSL